MSDRGLPRILSPHERIRLAHLQLLERGDGERYLGEVPLQDPAGSSPALQRTTRSAAHRRGPREPPARPLRVRSSAASSRSWTLHVQVMPEADAEKATGFNPFDLTKVWPHADLAADRGRSDAGARTGTRTTTSRRVEQLALSRPSNIVPGIGHSPGQDAPGAHLLVRGRAPVSSGSELRVTSGQRSAGHRGANVSPRRADAFRRKRRQLGELRAELLRRSRGRSLGQGTPAAPRRRFDRYDHREGNDDYTQAGDLFRLLDGDHQQRLARAIAEAMNGVPQDIIERQLAHFDRADPKYGQLVREFLA